jgi:hypothetical protein
MRLTESFTEVYSYHGPSSDFYNCINPELIGEKLGTFKTRSEAVEFYKNCGIQTNFILKPIQSLKENWREINEANKSRL